MGDETLEFLEACGLHVNKTNPRQYRAFIPALPEIVVLFQRPRDIPMSVAAGDIDLGITGYDTYAEIPADAKENIIVIHEALGYGRCDLVVAVPQAWDDVETMRDLAARAYAQNLRVATQYGNCVADFMREAGVENVRIVVADGALEAAPAIGYADFIVDITSSGTTLRENNLRTLSDGTVFRSEGIFIGNRERLCSDREMLATTAQMLEFFEAYLRAKNQYMVFANIRGATREEVTERVLSQPDLGGLQHPTLSQLIAKSAETNWWSINLVVAQSRLYTAIQQIRAIGGSGVVVTPVTYIFDELPDRSQRLLNAVR